MSLQNHLSSSGLLFDPQDVIDFHIALKTSPLVILTGVSGSGKTKLAQNYIDYMCMPAAVVTPAGSPAPARITEKHRYKFISVRSDWLDNKGLLGYYNPLLGIYYSTPVLELLLDAALEPDEPFFIILDEMNLAKAEYYFSDFLSAIESRHLSGGMITSEPIELHKAGGPVLAKAYSQSVDRDAALERMRLMPTNTFVNLTASGAREYFIPERIEIPSNVYIVGTINIDETTYRFSPKIIDRAHVLEMNGAAANDYFTMLLAGTVATGAGEYSGLHLTIEDLTHNRVFLSNKTEVDILSETDIINSNIRLIIEHLWSLLSNTPFRFSYRTINRILQYLFNGLELYRNSGITINNDIVYKLFDSEILLKVLPRIHGTRSLLEPLLTNLLYFCNINYSSSHFDLSMKLQRNPDLEDYLNATYDNTNSRFPRSAKRIARLLNDVVRTNYGSFI